ASDAARLALVFQGGSLWAMLLSLLWPVYPYKPARRAVTALYRALGDMAADLVDLATSRLTDAVRGEAAVEPWPGLDRQRLDDAQQKIVQQLALLDGATQRFIAARRG
ncbi:MAG TPA: hypothetical protein VF502_19850, partial [Stellaceae bacterium]